MLKSSTPNNFSKHEDNSTTNVVDFEVLEKSCQEICEKFKLNSSATKES